jgi:hypothetical protein
MFSYRSQGAAAPVKMFLSTQHEPEVAKSKLLCNIKGNFKNMNKISPIFLNTGKGVQLYFIPS